MLWIPIKRSDELPLTRQIYLHLRELILSGKLHAGEKLPSTRQLAIELQVSRNVVLEAYEQLMAEGFLASHRGAGTFVAEGTFFNHQTSRHSTPVEDHKAKENKAEPNIDFRSGIPDLHFFPRKIWAKLAQTIWHDTSASILSYDLPEGRLELREALAHYLLKTRGVNCHPNQIVITSGATQALTLVARLLLTAGDEVIIEDPITKDIQLIFQQAGAALLPIPVDEDGLQTALLPLEKQPKFVFITPSHQFPLGGTLPIQRRIHLLNYARATNCYLVEDDYDSEFRYEGSPVSSLQGLEPERVLYIGSFSKILSPALRMGYVILPSHLIDTCRRLKWFADLHTPSVEQLILARFIAEGHLEKHIFKMKRIYKKRGEILKQELQTVFGERIKLSGYSTGLHLIAEWQGIHITPALLHEIEQAGVRIYPVSEHGIEKGRESQKIIFGYGHLSEEEIKEGVTRLGQALSLRY